MNSTEYQIGTKDVSLGEFITLLILQLDIKGVSMPFQNEEKWHRLFYKFKVGRSQSGRPAFMNKLRFDWDGPYPKSQDLSEYLQILHLNGFISVANPTYDTLSVDEDVRKGIDKVRPAINDENLEKFLDFSTREASQLFSS
jgi:hypothetical protein